MDCRPPGSSVHRISQARILEWTAISFSRGSSQPKDGTHISYIALGFFYHWTTWKAPIFVTTVNTSYSSFSESRLKSKKRHWIQFWISSMGIKSPALQEVKKKTKMQKKTWWWWKTPAWFETKPQESNTVWSRFLTLQLKNRDNTPTQPKPQSNKKQSKAKLLVTEIQNVMFTNLHVGGSSTETNNIDTALPNTFSHLRRSSM